MKSYEVKEENKSCNNVSLKDSIILLGISSLKDATLICLEVLKINSACYSSEDARSIEDESFLEIALNTGANFHFLSQHL